MAKDDLTKVYYSPYVKETKLVVYYDIQDTSAPTTICTNYDSSIKSIEVDGTLLDSVVKTYQFDSVGEHVIKYEFNNPTTVGKYAPLFSNIKIIKRIVIADTFTSIGGGAFSGCTGLTSITIPDSVTSIGQDAFGGCSGLTSITIPDNVTNIDSGAFGGCTGLTNIVVDSANTVYDSRNNCNAIINTSTNELIAGCKDTIIPNSVTSIGMKAFSSCTGLTSIEIPSSVTSIGADAFYNCSSLTSITIPNSVTSIGSMAFRDCTGLTSVTSLATTAPTIQNSTFMNVKTGGTLTVPSGSSGYDTWMGTGIYYLGYYNWTKVEQ